MEVLEFILFCLDFMSEAALDSIWDYAAKQKRSRRLDNIRLLRASRVN